MKLKFLSLVCAFAIFAFGTNGMAQDAKDEAPAAPAKEMKAAAGGICPDGTVLKGAFESIVCKVPAVTKNADCKTFCDNITAKKPTKIPVVDSCIAKLQTLPAVGPYLKTFASTGCSLTCNTHVPLCPIPCKSDDPKKDNATFLTCTTICCPLDPTSIKQCLVDAGNKTCPAEGKSSAETSDVDEI
jgi:hypothetical protein